MSAYKSDFLNILAERGFIHQVSEPDVLDARLMAGTVTAYIGFDCTAPSLHVGSLVQIMMLYWAQQTGQRPIALMGGGTTRVGDPSGKLRGFYYWRHFSRPCFSPATLTPIFRFPSFIIQLSIPFSIRRCSGGNSRRSPL